MLTGGRADFEALQPRMHVTSPDPGAAARGADAGHLPDVRRAATRRAPADRPPVHRAQGDTREHHPERQRLALTAHVPRRGPGGRPCRLGRQRARGRGDQATRLRLRARRPVRNWLKIKNLLRQEVVVAGWKPGKGNRTGQIGSLLIGLHDDDGEPRLLRARRHRVLRRYAAHARPAPRSRCAVRTARSTGRCPRSMPRPCRLGRAPAGGRGGIRQLDPGRPHDARPPTRGLRDDKDPADVIRET